ncbi:MAG: 4Fe-4S dicluster domain-containing protein [Candidatus Bilamarchaeaceae archaeon]
MVLHSSRDVCERPSVLFGLHPCDIAALQRLDKVFSELFNDPYYNERRSKSLIIGITCNRPGEQCFCNIVGTGPDAENGYDLLMTDLGDRYFVRSATKAGERLLRARYFEDATMQDVTNRDSALKEAALSLKVSFSLDGLKERMAERYNDGLWDEYWKRCVTCGTCNMVCPTCHCFAILDKVGASTPEGRRVRVWDSCHFERFAKMAGGVDFRSEKSSRFKHRLYDKFDYCKARYGVVFCVGCGRCTRFCQSGIDLRDALRKIQEF